MKYDQNKTSEQVTAKGIIIVCLDVDKAGKYIRGRWGVIKIVDTLSLRVVFTEGR